MMYRLLDPDITPEPSAKSCTRWSTLLSARHSVKLVINRQITIVIIKLWLGNSLSAKTHLKLYPLSTPPPFYHSCWPPTSPLYYDYYYYYRTHWVVECQWIGFHSWNGWTWKWNDVAQHYFFSSHFYFLRSRGGCGFFHPPDPLNRDGERDTRSFE